MQTCPFPHHKATAVSTTSFKSKIAIQVLVYTTFKPCFFYNQIEVTQLPMEEREKKLLLKHCQHYKSDKIVELNLNKISKTCVSDHNFPTTFEQHFGMFFLCMLLTCKKLL